MAGHAGPQGADRGGPQNLEVAKHESLPKAREAAKADYQTALRREESLKDALQRQRGEAMTLSRDTVEYNNVRVEVETQRALVDNLLKREAEMQVLLRLQGERLSNVRIVETALPPRASFKPSYPKNGLLGLLAGLAAGRRTGDDDGFTGPEPPLAGAGLEVPEASGPRRHPTGAGGTGFEVRLRLRVHRDPGGARGGEAVGSEAEEEDSNRADPPRPAPLRRRRGVPFLPDLSASFSSRRRADRWS